MAARKKYHQLAQKAIDDYKPSHILKTDTYNEAKGRRPQYTDFDTDATFELVEYRRNCIGTARKNHPDINAKQGDIRSLPCVDNKFDMVFDFSTIDHVRPCDVSTVIGEYARVLNKDGILLIVFWCANSLAGTLECAKYKQGKVKVDDIWDVRDQYYFWYPDVRSTIKEKFSIINEGDLFTESDNTLKFILARSIESQPKHWEYLEEQQYDERFKSAAAFFADKVQDKSIVDLNCGSARFAKFISGYKKYTGNDIRQYNTPGMGIEFHAEKDSSFVPKVGVCDILMLWGASAGHLTKTSAESSAEYTSFMSIVQRCRPRYLVIEGIRKWERKHKYYSNFISNLVDYKVVLQEEIHVNRSRVGKRMIVILESVF